MGENLNRNYQLFSGYFIHSLAIDELDVFHGCVLINQCGLIEEIHVTEEGNRDLINNLTQKYQIPTESVCELNKNQFIIPGLIDSHCHAPQIVNLGRGNDLPLLDWLNKYTFPREAEFNDLVHAREVYNDLVKRLLRQGTTCASYYATIHLSATKLLADLMTQHGQRGFVGKVCMNINSPEYYCETSEECLRDNCELIEYLKENKMIRPVITPRFAISCSSDLMHSLGKLSREHTLNVQTHLSENKEEILFLKQLYPHLSYAQIYDTHNLFHERTIVAHCVYLTNDEIELVRERRVGISHCPTSNMNIMSGLLNVRPLIEKNVKLGLGSDFSGGYSSSILSAIVNAINTSKIVKSKDERALTFVQAFYLATLGNAHVVGLEEKIGNFKVGKCFDALLIDTKSPSSIMSNYKHDNMYEKFEKFLFTGDDRNIVRVYTNGNLVSKIDF